MLNYLKAELYKTLHRTYTHITLLISILIAVLLNVLFFVLLGTGGIATPQEAANLSLCVVPPMLMPMVYITLIMVDIVFSEEYKYRTFKNTLSYGFTRTQVYLGKLIGVLITAVSIYSIMLLFYFISNFVLFGLPANADLILILLNRIIAAVPLFIGALALCTALAFIIPNSTAFSFVYIGLAIIPYQLFYVLRQINPFWTPFYYAMLPTPFYTLLVGVSSLVTNAANHATTSVRINLTDYSTLTQFLSAGDMTYCIALGAAYLVITTLIGLSVFKKRDIR